ncbi:MAG: hypothetical protein HOV73_01745 [Streptomyces sp.]|nr:hypothetical protein [Streptomyces sp.]
MIQCEVCRRAELPRFQRLKEDALNLFLGPTPAQRIMHSAHVFSVYRAALAGAPATPYDRHREEYVRTGDPIELERMLRHVKEST